MTLKTGWIERLLIIVSLAGMVVIAVCFGGSARSAADKATPPTSPVVVVPLPYDAHPGHWPPHAEQEAPDARLYHLT